MKKNLRSVAINVFYLFALMFMAYVITDLLGWEEAYENSNAKLFISGISHDKVQGSISLITTLFIQIVIAGVPLGIGFMLKQYYSE